MDNHGRVKVLCLLMLAFMVGCQAQPTVTTESTAIAPTVAATATSPASVAATEAPLATVTATAGPATAATAVASVTAAPPTSAPEATTATSMPPAAGMAPLVDHTSVAQFDRLPDSAIGAAADIRWLVRHASVGDNITRGLDCLMNNFTDRRPSSCTPFFDPRYDRRSWVFEFRGNPGWIDKVGDFVSQVNSRHDEFQAFSFLFGYVDGVDGMTYPEISNAENFQSRYIDPAEALEAAYPDRRFIWWTMSLARLPADNTQKFNDMARDYAQAHGKPLLDLADIESHRPDGAPCAETTASGRVVEVICSDYTEDIGHLNDAGRERLARAVWVMMALVAGWDGTGP